MSFAFMLRQRARTLGTLACASLVAAAATSSFAQDAAASYPSKPIHIVAPFPPGGASDVMARLLGQKLSTAWGQPVIVENKPGANGNIGAGLVAKAVPDGYTLLLMDLGSLIISPSIMRNLTYSATKDLAPVMIAGYSPHILVVSNQLPVKSFDELVSYSKANPGKLNFGETPGAITHLAGVLIAQKKQLEWNYIAYKGGSQVIADLAGGQVDAAMNSYLATYPLVKSGKIRMLAVASPTRFKPIPDAPTVAESIPGFETGSYQGILAPAGTPKPIVEKLYKELAKIIASPEMKQRFEDIGTEPVNKTPEEFGAWLEKEIAFWGKVVRDNNVKVD
jgi:tripartite-type tricarboxylate transporter receptor subunit TctC